MRKGAAMCVLLCANRKVCERLDMPLAISYRESLKTCPTFQQSKVAQSAREIELDEAAQRRAMKRSAWLQAYCRYRAQAIQHGIYGAENGVLSGEWQKALEAIA